MSRRIAEEQAALRRVATLVASGAAPAAVFASVTEEAGGLLGAHLTVLGRYGPDGVLTVVGAWYGGGPPESLSVGSRVELGGRNTATEVFETSRPARIDGYTGASGAFAEPGRTPANCCEVGVPISIEGQLWGVVTVAYPRGEPLPPDIEARLAGFTELVATAIANAQARMELRGFAEEQAALRRVATLVARAAPPEEVFAAVTEEVGRMLSADATILSRYDPDGVATTVAPWTRIAAPVPPVGTRVPLGGENPPTLVFETGRPARTDDYDEATGKVAEVARGWGVHSSVSVPIEVDGRLWGVMSVLSGRTEPLPAETEDRLVGFTELIGTAIANAQAHVELRGRAEEQAALRRVATLVAQAAPPAEVFASVATEVGRLLEVDYTVLSRYDPDGAVTVVGGWARHDPGRPPAVGVQLEPGGQNMHALVFRSRRPARIDDYGDASGAAADMARDWGFHASVGVPIEVGRRLWGVISVATAQPQPLPADTETRLAGFTQLIATALANADAQAALTASRARIVAAADTTRRRIERDLHDGAQQRLVSLALQLRGAQAATPPEGSAVAADLDPVVDGLTEVLEELREIARGLHPAALAEGGLRPALKSLARRSAVPVRLDMRVDDRFPEPIEIAVYYVVSEALTNAVKHAAATAIDVEAGTEDGMLNVRVRDDGRGGAELSRGSGLVGLTDRVEALGGRLSVFSPPGRGTTVAISLPLPAPAGQA